MQQALNDTYPLTKEFFSKTIYETDAINNGIAVDSSFFQNEWEKRISDVVSESTLALPPVKDDSNGKNGVHTQELTGMLEEMQQLQREMPGCTW